MSITPAKSAQDILSQLEPGAILLSEPEELTGGRSGAKVQLLHIRGGNDFSGEQTLAGYRIMKTIRTSSSDGDENIRYQQCFRHAPAFMARFAPELLPKSFQEGDWSYFLFAMANPLGAKRAAPLSLDDERLPHIAERLSKRLLSGLRKNDPLAFNRNPQFPSNATWEAVLLKWLGNRINFKYPHSARIRQIRESLIRQRKASEEEILFDGQLIHDPLVKLTSSKFKAHEFTPCYGWLHGDLHLRNILCPPLARDHQSNIDYDAFWIIDFAMAFPGPLLYDHAYLIVFLLCSLPEDLPENVLWRLLRMDQIIPDPRTHIVHSTLLNIEKSVNSWRTENLAQGPNTLQQWDLAMFAAGINWANKQYDPSESYKARRAYLISAFALRRLLENVGEYDSPRSLPTEPAPRPTDLGKLEFLKAIPVSVGASMSGLLILNALLTSGVAWETIAQYLAFDGFWKLRNGRALDPFEEDRLGSLVNANHLFSFDGDFKAFLACSETDKASLEKRLALVGVSSFDGNRRLRELITNKLTFKRASWLDGVEEKLQEVASWGNRPRSERTWNLKQAYYHAGIRLTIDQMADAAIAEFGHERWQLVINREPGDAHGHLRVANITIGRLTANILRAESLTSKDLTIVEGGVGGCHTTYYLFDELTKAAGSRPIRYFGIELVPALAEEMNAALTWPLPVGERATLFHSLKKQSKLLPIQHGKPMVVTGRMEEWLVKLWDEFREDTAEEPVTIDAFVTSFAFHHVPNGQAIIRFISSEAQGIEETLDRDDHREKIAKAMADGCRGLFDAYVQAETIDALGMLSYSAKRQAIINEFSADCPQAGVFLSLLEPSAVSEAIVSDFCSVIMERFSFPSTVLRCMLRNPQREVLLTAQSLLRDQGLLIIADPDGNSDFNAENAHLDPELTVANFLSSDELRGTLEDIGFMGIEVYRVVKQQANSANAGEEFAVAKQPRHNPWESAHTSEPPDFGYIVVARRDQRRERELSSFNRGLLGDTDRTLEEGQQLEPDIESVGKLLHDGWPATKKLVRHIFGEADPIPHTGRVFRNHPKLRRLLHSLGWLRALQGASVVATKRIHFFEQSAALPLIFVATDFPHSPQEAREDAKRVFSYSDEALVMRPRLESILDGSTPKESKILDLCCGAGTLGLLCAALKRDATVVCVDKEVRAIRQVQVNRALNGIPKSRLLAEVGDMWNFPSAGLGFHLIVSDPSFSLRPESFVSGTWEDDGGKHGDTLTGKVLAQAAVHLEHKGTLLILGYSLVEHDPRTRSRHYRIENEKLYPHPNIIGEFSAVVPGYVWRFRHDKIASNDINDGNGMPLHYLVLRLADPTRPESITFESPQKQRAAFKRYTEWLISLSKSYSGLRFVMGEFVKSEG